jgi:hypothetical protein
MTHRPWSYRLHKIKKNICILFRDKHWIIMAWFKVSHRRTGRKETNNYEATKLKRNDILGHENKKKQVEYHWSSLENVPSFGRRYSLHLQGRNISQAGNQQKPEANWLILAELLGWLTLPPPRPEKHSIYSSVTSAFFQNTQRYRAEDHIVHSHCRVSFKPKQQQKESASQLR